MPIFETLRVSLSLPSEPSLFDVSAANDPAGSREEFFRFAFLQRHDFTYWQKRYSYIPIGSDGEMFAGIVGREISELVHGGPDTGFELTEAEEWQIAFIFFDAKTQIVSVQKNTKVGQPRRLLETLLEAASQEAPHLSHWKVHVEYISSKEDFWVVVREFTGRITSINFTFIPPNALGAKEAVDGLVRAASEQANAEATEIRLKNPNGHLKPSGELVETALDTATKGGGEVNVKVGKQIVFSSSKNRKKEEVSKEEMPRPSIRDSVMALGRRLLGLQ